MFESLKRYGKNQLDSKTGMGTERVTRTDNWVLMCQDCGAEGDEMFACTRKKTDLCDHRHHRCASCHHQHIHGYH
jgi:hypothetical protein